MFLEPLQVFIENIHEPLKQNTASGCLNRRDDS